jgi:excinuclease UvrABC ATPase subunit
MRYSGDSAKKADRVQDPARAFNRLERTFPKQSPGTPRTHPPRPALSPSTAAHSSRLSLPAPLDEAAELLLREVRTRLGYLTEVGLSYLTLDRQSRTLSGGEVQRINLTTALGTSLVNTLFVLDEPSIGLHPRDMGKVIGVLRKLRDAGNTLLVVEHDPQVMLAADRILDLGPGPGERGGEVVFFGTPAELLRGEEIRYRRYLKSPAPFFKEGDWFCG